MNTLIVLLLIFSIIQLSISKPTAKPVAKPSQFPTNPPTPSPTFAPTTSPTLIPTNGPTTLPTPDPTVKAELVRNASSKGGQVAGAFLGILFAAFIVYLWYSKTYGPIFKDSGDYVPDEEHNIEIKNPMNHRIQSNNDDDKF